MPVAFAALCGLIVGSFLNVVAYRLPRGESLVTPGSHCPSCSTAIRPYDNLPVLDWLALRGRCHACGDVDLGALPAGRGAHGRPCGRGRARRALRPRHRAGAGADRDPRPDRVDRPRPPDHPERDHASRRARRGRDRPANPAGRRSRAADRGSRGRGLPARVRARVSTRDGDGRCEAGRRARAVPRSFGRRRVAGRRAPGRDRRRGDHGAGRRHAGPQDGGPVRSVPGARGSSGCSPGRRSCTCTCTPWSEGPTVSTISTVLPGRAFAGPARSSASS